MVKNAGFKGVKISGGKKPMKPVVKSAKAPISGRAPIPPRPMKGR